MAWPSLTGFQIIFLCSKLSLNQHASRVCLSSAGTVLAGGFLGKVCGCFFYTFLKPLWSGPFVSCHIGEGSDSSPRLFRSLWFPGPVGILSSGTSGGWTWCQAVAFQYPWPKWGILSLHFSFSLAICFGRVKWKPRSKK